MTQESLRIEYVPLASLRHPEKNPRTWTTEAIEQLKESIRRYGVVDPLVINHATNRQGIIVGGNFRAMVLREMGVTTVPVVYVNIPDPEKEAELVIRLNKNIGSFDLSLLAEFDESILKDIGFSSEELDTIFVSPEEPEQFDLEKELAKIGIKEITIKYGDRYDFGHDIGIVMCGDSTIEDDVLKLMDGEKADMVFTDEPYVLDYTKGKKRSKATEGFGYKRDRRYLGTDTLPPYFMARWLANVHKVQKDDFSIISFENWKNLKQMWEEMEKYYKIRNVIIWSVPNRVQGFAAKYKFFDKFDIAVVGTSGDIALNVMPETELLQNDYEAALFATSGHPHWEPYAKGKKYCPTDFIQHAAADEKNSGQGVVFGTKPVEILIPYVKVLTKRGDLILEPFGGSGSTAVAAYKLGRQFRLMEKSPVYTTVILKRLEKLTGRKAEKVGGV